MLVEHGAHLQRQSRGSKRLLLKGRTGIEQSALDYILSGISRHVEDRQIRLQLGQTHAQLPPAHLGHDDIRDYQMDRVRVLPDVAQCLDPIPGFYHVITVIAQSAACQVPHDVLVLDNQNGLGSAPGDRDLSTGRLLGSDIGCRPRQIDLERAALAWLAVDPDVAPPLFDDPINRGKPQPGPLTYRLGGKEGLEDAGLHIRIHPAAIITYRQHYISAQGYVDA